MNMKYLKNVVTLQLDRDVCVGCGICLDVCPHGVFVLEDGKSRIADPDACMECGACARNCPVHALNVKNGVGCAIGILNSTLGRTAACCGEKQDCSCDGSETND
jgi:NAD-dependent dihydropyrimidine dehydrogenase PreA subunit